MKENYTLEEQSIIDQAQATGTYLKAPNGEDTNLTPEQWVYVRTAAFKRWFGDWQDNPDNASKILDKKGEPEVIYHSTNEGMLRAFDKVVESSRNNSYYGNGFYFNYGNGELSKGEAEYYGTGVLGAFANIRNPFYFSMLTHYNGTDISSAGSSSLCFLYNIAKLFLELEGNIEFLSTGHYEGDYYIPDLSYSFSDYIELVDRIGNNLTYTTRQDMDDNPVRVAVFHTGKYDEWTDHEGKSHSYEITKIVGQYHIDTPDDILKNEAVFDSLSEVYNLVADLHPEGYMDRYPEITEAISNRGYDGILESEYGDELVVLSTNQVKSASLNAGTFSLDHDDIRYRFIGEKGAANLDRAEEATYRLDNLFVAKEMEFVGKDALSIKIATGWERGVDDKWRYEDRDLNIQSEYVGKYKDSLTGSNTPVYYIHNQITPGSVGRLSDFISDDNLFIAYPEIADWEMKVLSNRAGYSGAAGDGMIALSKSYFSEVYEILNSEDIAMARAKIPGLYERIPEEMREVAMDLVDAYGGEQDRMSNTAYSSIVELCPEIEEMIKALDDIPLEKRGDLLGFKLSDIAERILSHEVQHAIQHIEGFAHGGNLNMQAGKATDERKDIDEYIRLSGEVEARNVQSRMGMSPEEKCNSLAKLTEDVRREDQIFIKNAFSGSMHPSQAEFISAIEDLANSIHIPVDIIGDIDELSDSVAKRKIEAGYNIKGWFIPETNNVAIYLPNISGVEDAQRTVFHEVVAHYGLRMMFGDHFDIFLDNVYNNATSEIQGKIMYATHGDPAKRLVATEEYLAKLAERGFHNQEEISFWKKAKFAFIDMLWQAGVKLGFKLHDNDLRGILWKSYQNLCQKDASVWRDEQGKGIVEKSNVTSLLSTDKEFKSAVEKNEYIKLCQLKESGYVPSKNVMQSLNSISGKALVAVQKIFGLNSMGDSLAEVETLQGWLCDRKVPLPFMKDKNDYFIV